MALSGSFGYTAESESKSLSIPDMDWDGGNYAVITKGSDTTIVTNTTSPLDQPETIRWSVQGIRNIYANTGIDPAYFATSKRGVSLLAQTNDIYRISDSDNATYRVDLPVSSHFVVKAPLHDLLTPDIILSVILRNVSNLFDTGSTGSSRLAQLLRSGTTPTNL
jgi:hypothetical protein